jgi:hypothetical protein
LQRSMTTHGFRSCGIIIQIARNGMKQAEV